MSKATHYAWLSIFAAVVTISLKLIAYFLTGSVGLLSDAMESFINLAGALIALWMLTIALRPADEDHVYGHSKAEYFSSGIEGLLIFIAAIFIGYAAIERLLNPQPLEKAGLGILVTVIASLVNLIVSLVLTKASKRFNSITLEADAKHLMTDVWTSAGVIIGVGAVVVTGWYSLDPIIALVVAANIIWTGYSIIRKSVSGLMDKALPTEEQERILEKLNSYKNENIEFHEILTRQAGAKQFLSFHVLVPGAWTVQEGHHLLEEIEADLTNTFPNIVIITHLEPLEDPASYRDITLRL